MAIIRVEFRDNITEPQFIHLPPTDETENNGVLLILTPTPYLEHSVEQHEIAKILALSGKSVLYAMFVSCTTLAAELLRTVLRFF